MNDGMKKYSYVDYKKITKKGMKGGVHKSTIKKAIFFELYLLKTNKKNN